MDYDDDNSVIYLPQNMCRACLTSLSDEGIDIAENFTQEAEEWNIIEQFHYFNVQIAVDDGKPQQICRHCFFNLRLATSFLLLCQKSQAVLDTYIRLTENNEQDSQEEKVCLRQEEEEVPEEKPPPPPEVLQELSEQQVIEALAEQGILITYVEENAERACLEPGILLNLDGEQVQEVSAEQLLSQMYIEQELQQQQICDDLIEVCPEYVEEQCQETSMCNENQEIIEYTYVQPNAEEELVVNEQNEQILYHEKEEEEVVEEQKQENMEVFDDLIVEEEVIPSGGISESSGDCNFEESSSDSSSIAGKKDKSAVEMDNNYDDVENAIHKYLVQKIPATTSPDEGFDGSISDHNRQNHEMMSLDENSEFMLKCGECGAEFLEQEEVDSHMRSEHGISDFICHLCSDKCEDAMDFHIHMESHGERCAIECSVCNREEKENLEVKLYKCKDCEKSFLLATSLHRHRRIHAKPTTYPCQQCGKQFLKENHLKLHMRKHRENRPHTCEICGDSFASRGNLTSHMKSHKTKPFRIKCDLCETIFLDREAHEKHMKIHGVKNSDQDLAKISKIPPLICESCGIGYTSPAEFTKHLTLHQQVDKTTLQNPNGHKNHWGEDSLSAEPTTSRPNGKTIENPVETVWIKKEDFSCEFCTKEFNSYSALASHVFKHEGLELPKSIGLGDY